MNVLLQTVALFFVFAAVLESKPSGREVGPKVGEKFPNIVLRDQNGVERHITELLGENGAVIDVYRSADW